MSTGGLLMGVFQELLYNSYLVSNLFFTIEKSSEGKISPSSKDSVKIGT